MIVLHATPGADAAAVLTQLKLAALRFPGDQRLKIVVLRPWHGGERRTVMLGRTWRYDGSAACLAALGEFGRVEVTDG